MLSEELIKKVQVICPVCKTKEIITLPLKILRNYSHLTTVSIPKGKVCDHHFQIFIDKSFNIRGYQKVDFELKFNKKLQNSTKNGFMNGLELYEKNPTCNIPRKIATLWSAKGKNEIELNNIYEEFWEFIDEDNALFRNFILGDKRRQN